MSSSRSPEAEPAKVSKRKGTRSVSTLTPSQLARKRANDREAQRAIRARTKEHIERLERELEEFKSNKAINELLRRNKALEREVARLQAAIGGHPSSYPQPGYDIDGLPTGSAVSSRASSFGNGSGEYNTTPGFGPSYLPTPEPCEPWTTVVPVSAVSVPSVVSSPCSSTGHPGEDYVQGYIPTSVPTSMMGGSVVQPANMSCLEEAKVEFEDIDATTPADHGLPHSSSSAYLQQQSWSLYPPTTYYANPPTI